MIISCLVTDILQLFIKWLIFLHFIQPWIMCVRCDHSWQSSKLCFCKEAFVCILLNNNQGNEDTARVFFFNIGNVCCNIIHSLLLAFSWIIFFNDKHLPPSWSPFLHSPFTLSRILSKAISWTWHKYKYAKLCHCSSVFLKLGFFFPLV